MSLIRPIVLPLSPTDNALRMPIIRGKGRAAHPEIIKDDRYRSWVKVADRNWKQWKAENDWDLVYQPTEEKQLEFEYRLYLKNRKPDIGNFVKAIGDFLGGNKTHKRLYKDDHWVTFRLARAAQLDPDNPRILINPFPKTLPT